MNGGGGPSPTATTILVNGSFRSTPPWDTPGSPEFNAIGATFGVTPVQWLWRNDLNQFAGVIFPDYSGIAQGAFELALFIDSLPAGDVNVVAHSHGGNVVGLATWIANRPLKHVINLATPINYDLQYARWMAPPPWAPYSRCQASSFVDAIQFLGASFIQVQEFIYTSYDAQHFIDLAIEDFRAGNEAQAFAESAFAAYYGAQALGWWYSTKIEWSGPTYMWWTKWHSAMHEPDVWAELAGPCALN